MSQLTAERAGEDGSRVFITEPDTRAALSFADLERATGELSQTLARRGLRQGDRVLLLFYNGIGAAVAFLAVAASGGVAVPAGPDCSRQELDILLTDSGARFLLAAASLPPVARQKLAAFPDHTLLPGDMELYVLPQDGGRHPDLPDDAALLMYTSGSTGAPKGVMLTHSNLLAECGHIREAHRLESRDTVLCLLPLHHINGLVVTLLTPLYAGLKVIMPPRFSAGRFRDWVRAGRPTWFSAVPAIYSILLGNSLPPKEELSCLRFARSASSALPETVLREFERRTGTPVIESYGITEGGSQITTNPLPPLVRKAGSVGLPFGNEVLVLREDGRPASVGEVGEVAVRGDNIAAGYYGKPDATRAGFRDGLFFTGDLGCLDADGYLFLRGRKKELINRAGEMVSPREVDDVLYAFPGVELAAAVGVPHPLYGEEIIAFIRARAGENISEEAVKLFCGERLSAFKAPKRIYFITDFPQAPSGKIRRLKLTERYQAMPAPERLPAPVRNPQTREKIMTGQYAVHLDFEACKACGYCALVCSGNVFDKGADMNKKGRRAYLAARPEACTGCRRCFYMCPDFCLEVTDAPARKFAAASAVAERDGECA
ncbi:MAG: AMP-binding protein [Desulfovibrio sp.]|nr:AMP-binding protein [Desulfovibrio sp.]